MSVTIVAGGVAFPHLGRAFPHVGSAPAHVGGAPAHRRSDT